MTSRGVFTGLCTELKWCHDSVIMRVPLQCGRLRRPEFGTWYDTNTKAIEIFTQLRFLENWKTPTTNSLYSIPKELNWIYRRAVNKLCAWDWIQWSCVSEVIDPEPSTRHKPIVTHSRVMNKRTDTKHKPSNLAELVARFCKVLVHVDTRFEIEAPDHCEKHWQQSKHV